MNVLGRSLHLAFNVAISLWFLTYVRAQTTTAPGENSANSGTGNTDRAFKVNVQKGDSQNVGV